MDESGELLVCGGSWVLESAAGLTISWLVVKERRIDVCQRKNMAVVCLKERLLVEKREKERRQLDLYRISVADILQSIS